MTATPVLRSCPLCGNPTAPAALLEAHVGPAKGHPQGDVVVWLCPACAQAVTDPGRQPQPIVGGWAR